mgnify:CR=1 FL=1
MSGGLLRKPSPVALRRMRATFTPEVVQQLQQIERDLGGRPMLVGMLALAPLTADLQYVLGMLGDPLHHDKSLAEICGMGNILPGELLRHLASAALLKGKVMAAQRIGAGMPAVIDDIMRRAAPYTDLCGTCLGMGSLTPDPTPETPNPVPGPCETCRGSGQLLYRPDLERQKLAVDLAQLLPKGGGIQIAQVNSAGAGAGGQGASGVGVNTFDAVQRVVDQVLYGPSGGFAPADDETIDGELTPPEEGAEGKDV